MTLDAILLQKLAEWKPAGTDRGLLAVVPGVNERLVSQLHDPQREDDGLAGDP